MPFEAYIQRHEKQLMRMGVCKIVAPEGWEPRTATGDPDFMVGRPIKQHAIGSRGMWRMLYGGCGGGGGTGVRKPGVGAPAERQRRWRPWPVVSPPHMRALPPPFPPWINSGAEAHEQRGAGADVRAAPHARCHRPLRPRRPGERVGQGWGGGAGMQAWNGGQEGMSPPGVGLG